MDQRLDECLHRTESTEYILPFFWMHGEDRDTLLRQIQAIEKANITQFCLESRVYDRFCCDEWWADMEFILKEAQKRGMRVWLLDDKRFPSGYANGYIKSHPQLRRLQLKCDFRDIANPIDTAVTVPSIAADEKFVGIYAFRLGDNGKIYGQPVPLTDRLKNGILRPKLDLGIWRIFYLISTRAAKGLLPDQIDMLSAQSCECMIDQVYRPHYSHFAQYFGNTFAGFFSDEPEFANFTGSYNSVLGNPEMRYIPWRDDLVRLIAENTGMTEDCVETHLPLLFENCDIPELHELRRGYMDTVSTLYRENFSKRLGNWCRDHGVMYIGHIIEDDGCHQRIGHGAGHFFRAVEYQDMSGIDTVLHQFAPGITEMRHSAPVFGKTADPEFNNYLLAKLAVSQAHTTERMHGRSLCEIFGAYGWAEGVPMMKMLADHMLANGINLYVPHAFSPKYPDPDCPPHFYADGKNPQFEAFGQLMLYMRRVCHIITGALHRTPVALFYNAESEWAAMPFVPPQKIAKTLTRAQIDFDLLCPDTLDKAYVQDGKICVCNQRYRALLMPKSEGLSEKTLSILRRLSDCGAKIIDVTEKNAADLLKADGIYDIRLDRDMPHIRYYRGTRGKYDIYIFASEDTANESRFEVLLPDLRQCRLYDPWRNSLYTPIQNGNRVSIYLPQSGMIMLIAGEDRPLTTHKIQPRRRSAFRYR